MKPRKASDAIEIGLLRDLVDYDPETGVFRWRVHRGRGICRIGMRAGMLSPRGYRYICINGKNYRAGRLAWFYVLGRWPIEQIDHINRVRDDDRFANLREADFFINARNRFLKRSHRLGKQISFRADHQRWRTAIRMEGRTYYIGSFVTRDQAEAAWQDAASRIWATNLGEKIAQ